jgi:hypothetical protein
MFFLLLSQTRVIHVVTAVLTAEGKHMTTITEESKTKQAPAAIAEPKAAKKARVGARGAHVAPSKGKAGKKASPAKKAPTGQKRADKPETPASRAGSKTAQVLSC